MNEKQLMLIDHAISDAQEGSLRFNGDIGRLDYELDVFENLLIDRHEDYPDDLAKVNRLRRACVKMMMSMSEFAAEMDMFKEAFYDDSDNDQN